MSFISHHTILSAMKALEAYFKSHAFTKGNPWLNVDLNDKFIMGDSLSLHGYKKGWSNAITHIATTLANKALVNILC